MIWQTLKTGLRRTVRAAVSLGHGQSLYVPPVSFHSGLDQGAWLLHGLARTIRPAVCVEIGSARGCSTCYIGLALRQMGRGKLFAIDPHAVTDWNDSKSTDTYDVLRENLRAFGVEDYVEIVRKYSAEAAEGWQHPIDMLFIDGDHSYDGVRRDWDLFMPHVREFGIVVFHDTTWSLNAKPRAGGAEPRRARRQVGVSRFVEELRVAGYPAITINQYCGITLVQPVQGGVRLVR
ncbi:MAG: class I SAM-dependent methyltransferase [Thermoguttaceae bacterium]